MGNANIEAWVEMERKAQLKALELVGDCHPCFNITPTLELVRQAWALGYDVVRPTPLNIHE